MTYYIHVHYLAPGGIWDAVNVGVGTMLASPESNAPIIILIVNTINVHTTGTWLMNSDDVLYSIKWKRQSRSKFRDRNIIPMNTLQESTKKTKKTNKKNCYDLNDCVLYILFDYNL